AVKFDRILEGFDGPFEKLPGEIKPPAGRITDVPAPAGYLLSHQVNDAFIAVNRLLQSQEEVYWLKTPLVVNGKTYPIGTQFIPAKPSTQARLQKMAAEIGLSFDAVAAKPAGESMMLRPPRIGLWDRSGGSVQSGWTRYVLEKFEFPFTVVTPNVLERGRLAQAFDVLVFVDDADTITPAIELKAFLQDGGTIAAIGDSTKL